MLVAAVLGPEQREDRELEVVRLALEQLTDSPVLAVGKTESAMERLFRDPRQRDESVAGSPVSRDEAEEPRDAARARRDLGRVVHVHQGRGPGDLARDADRRPPGSRGADAGAAPALHRRHARHRAPAARELAVARGRRARQHRASVLAPVVGRDPDRLGARVDHPGCRPDLQCPDRLRRVPGGARDRLAARGRGGRLRRRCAARRRPARREDARRARDRRDGVLLRPRRPARGTAPDPREADRCRVRDDGDLDGGRPSGRRRPGSERGAWAGRRSARSSSSACPEPRLRICSSSA